MKIFHAVNRADWRQWLSKNFDKLNEIWLVYYKKDSGKDSVGYNESVEEALCFGWIDSIIKKIDESSYARKFTPRKENSVWSETNKKRARKMIGSGLMTEQGLKLIESAKKSGAWDKVHRAPKIDLSVSEKFARALTKNKRAEAVFEKLSKRHREEYTGWINSAKRDETRARRIKQAIAMLAEDKKLGLK